MRPFTPILAASLLVLVLAPGAGAQEDLFEQLQQDVEEQQRALGIDPDAPVETAPPPDAEFNFPPTFDEPLPNEGAYAPPPEGVPPGQPGSVPGEGEGQIAGDGETAPATEAPREENPIAVFSGLDKITGRITSFDVHIDETVQFGALQVTPKVCMSSAAGSATQTDGFVQVDEITLQQEIQQIFSGWMFADSPGLNALEHPVYDVWLTSCRTEAEVPAAAG